MVEKLLNMTVDQIRNENKQLIETNKTSGTDKLKIDKK